MLSGGDSGENRSAADVIRMQRFLLDVINRFHWHASRHHEPPGTRDRNGDERFREGHRPERF
jgi:hypothetical protein